MKRENMVEVIDSIFTPSFAALIENYYKTLNDNNKSKEQVVYIGDIIDFMNQHKTDYRQDITMLCGILIKLVEKARKQAPELTFEK